MGRNAAFGRPQRQNPLRIWWEARTPASRTNTLLALGVGVVAAVLVLAAVARDPSPATPAANVIRPPLNHLDLPTPSTVVIDGLGGGAPAASLLGSTTTTSTTPPQASTTVRAAPATTSPPVATTSPPAPATTVTNPDVIFSTVPTTQATLPPVTTSSTVPPTTAPTTTTTIGLTLPLKLPPLLEPS